MAQAIDGWEIIVMKNKFRLINRSCILLLFFLYISAAVLCLIPLNSGTKLKCFPIFFISLLLLTALSFISMYIQLTHFCYNIEDIISAIINGKTIPACFEEDTLFSRIYHQLYQLQNILVSANNTVIENRDNLQLLISDIAHQVKTPLTNLNLLLSSFQQYDLSYEERYSFTEMMSAQINKITSLLESMIKTSRLENGIISLQPVMCPLSTTVQKAISEIRPSLEKKGIRLNCNFSKNILCFHDSKWTAEALYNILENAVKYTPENGSISLKAEELHSYIQITISDTGIGIAPYEYSKIFQRFYRSPNVHNEAGVGLGLYLARNIITQQNGYISVSSELNRGTAFTILISKR